MENPKLESAGTGHLGHGDACLLQVGQEVYPVYGSVDQGWSVERLDLVDQELMAYRYGSIEEIFFALVNFSLCQIGEA